MASFNNQVEYATIKLAEAVDHDHKGQIDSAITIYLEAVDVLMDVRNKTGNRMYDKQIAQYLDRVELLKSTQKSQPTHSASAATSSTTAPAKLKSQLQKDFEKIELMLKDAADEYTENKNYSEARDLYWEAGDFYLKLKKERSNEFSKDDDEVYKKLKASIQQGFDRIEEIDKILLPIQKLNLNTQQLKEPEADQNLLLENDDDKEDASGDIDMESKADSSSSSVEQSFTADELSVLRHGTFINGRAYVPYMPHIDAKEKFYFTIPFTDKDGKLALSPSQRERFARWARPDELFEQPSLMMTLSHFSVKQTCISDCSFVASLTICAQYEKRFNKKLISNIIYPQNKRGEPIYNPCGKYMVKLNLNGHSRKVIVDDFFPVDRHNEMLCSRTTNRGELWVSLLEKAYLKVMGGYDFPGSNSNIDLHALTSWIPERLAMHGKHTDFNANADFDRMFMKFHDGSVLLTVATGFISKDHEERSGLVSTHAYAILDIRKFQTLRLFKLKNPWSHLRWKGNFSEYDVRNWTDELKKALDYDPHLASNIDNGIFWIDYSSLMNHFDVFYISWNPSLFPYTLCVHRKWSAGEGPIKDQYNLSENPQYVLKIAPHNQRPSSSASNTKTTCSTWIVLTRHITDKDDFAENKEYIALVVYKSNGKRIYYPMEPEPYKEGIRINSPHYLVKLVDEIGSSTSPIQYTLVISQYEKYHSIYYTLRAYSTNSFTLSEIKEPYKSKFYKKIEGKWEGSSAGGCINYQETYKLNPLYQITISNMSSLNCVKIELKAPKNISVGFDVNCVKSNVDSNPESNFKLKSTGDYRRGFCVLALNNICGGVYTIRPSTYLPKQECPFILEIKSNTDYQIVKIN